jgi:hypothetical protein
MTEEKLKQVMYAVGWIEGRLEEDLAAVKDAESQDLTEIEHRQQMLDAYLLVSGALDTLRRQNSDYETKLMLARNALQ